MALVQFLVSFLHFFPFLNFIDLLNHLSDGVFFSFRSRNHLLFVHAKLQSNPWHLTVFITYKLIESRTIPDGRSSKKIKRLSTIKMRCSTRDEIIFSKNVEREKKRTFNRFSLSHSMSKFICCAPKSTKRKDGRERKKRTCRLSAEIIWTIILMIMFVFERNSSKKYSIFFSSHIENQV